MRHLVTGGAGFIGSALVKRLLDEGEQVSVLDRLSRGKPERLDGRSKIWRGDIRDEAAVGKAARGCDVIWHLAYVQGTQTFYAEPRQVIDVALTGIMNVLDAAEHSDADLFVVSSSEVYQEPPAGMYPTDETVPLSVPDVTNPRYSYGGGKIASEIAALAYATDHTRTVIVRPHNVIGPDMGEDHVVPQLARRVQQLEMGERLEIQGDGTATRCFCYVKDAVDGLMVLWKHGANREVYHLGNPEQEVTIRELAERITRFYGRRVEIAPTELPKGSPQRRVPSIRKLRRLGYSPAWSLEAALSKTLDWYRA